MKKKRTAPAGGRDIEKAYSPAATAAKLRRLADALERGGRFQIQIGGKRIRVPAHAVFTIEHEVTSNGDEEVEFQFKWNRNGGK